MKFSEPIHWRGKRSEASLEKGDRRIKPFAVHKHVYQNNKSGGGLSHF
jgi:hypothetical protein